MVPAAESLPYGGRPRKGPDDEHFFADDAQARLDGGQGGLRVERAGGPVAIAGIQPDDVIVPVNVG